jgi:transketolase
MDTQRLKKIASNIRFSIIDMLVPKESHHIGCSLSMVEILTTLYFDTLVVYPEKPDDKNRDIFILSKGHGAGALYATLAERGFFKKNILQKYDTDGGVLPEHSTKVVPGIEASTGSLGHGLPIGIGFALDRLKDKSESKVYVLLSDGELDEGSNWEAIMFAGHHQLRNLTVIVDLNGFQGYAETKKVIDLSPLSEKIKLFGWEVKECDGHNMVEISQSLSDLVKTGNKPKMIIAHTVKGKGIPYFEGKFEAHYKSIDEETKQKILKEL